MIEVTGISVELAGRQVVHDLTFTAETSSAVGVHDPTSTAGTSAAVRVLTALRGGLFLPWLLRRHDKRRAGVAG
ncbi:hypothetical protein [Actinokineospora sp. NPDC004072]